MQYLQRRLHRSVTDKRKLRSGLPKVSMTGTTESLANADLNSFPLASENDSRLTPYAPRLYGCSSTQTSPSGVCSSFQIGVICFNSSIAHLQARNASARCSAPTTIST